MAITFRVTVPAPPGEGVFADQSVITVGSFTYTLDRAMPVAYSCTGRALIRSTQNFSILSKSPASQIISGYWANGMMVNPFTSSADQAFDDMMRPGGQPNTPSHPTNLALNVDPGYTGVPYAVTAGQSLSLVSSIRNDGVTVDDWNICKEYDVLTILDPAIDVPDGFFTPGYAGTVKTIPGADTGGTNVLRNLPALSLGINKATAEARTPRTIMYGTANGEAGRRLLLPIQGDYSRDWAKTIGEVWQWLHTTGTWADKRQTFLRMVQWGIDLDSLVQAGWEGREGAGQSHAFHPFHFLAAFHLGNPAMLARAQNLRSNMRTQTFWVTSALEGFAASYPFNNTGRKYHDTYTAEHIGIPEWHIQGRPEFDYDASEANSSEMARYRATAIAGFVPDVMATALLVNGPGAVAGDAAMINGANDATNDDAAAIAYMDRYMSLRPFRLTGTNGVNAELEEAYDERRDLIVTPRWEGIPDRWSPLDGWLTAINNGFSYEADIEYSSLPVTRRDIRYSIDGGVSWVEVNDTTATGSVTGLRVGVEHRVSERRHNSLGAGLWSQHWPENNDEPGPSDSAPRGAVTPTDPGNLSNSAPTVVQAASIRIKRYPATPAPDYIACPDPMPQTTTELTLGVGYPTGYPAPTPTYRWLINGTPISGQTGQTIQTSALSPGELTGEVTWTNASGNVVSTSAAITVEAATQGTYLPTGTFGGLPSGWTGRWVDSAVPLSLTLVDAVPDNITYGQNTTNTSYNRFWSLDAAGLVDLADVPEGDVVFRTDGGTTSTGNGNQRRGIIIRGTGTGFATASGYGVELIFATNGTVQPVLVRYNGDGTRTLTTRTAITSSFGRSTDNVLIRVNWLLNTGTLEIRLKAWVEADGEPGTWWETFTDASPRPSGRLGWGTTANRSAQLIQGVGVSTNPANPAPIP